MLNNPDEFIVYLVVLLLVVGHKAPAIASATTTTTMHAIKDSLHLYGILNIFVSDFHLAKESYD